MIKNTPKLRFNEYNDNWIEYPLSDLANLARGKFSVRPRNDPRYFGGNIPFIQTSDIVKSSIYVEKYSQTLNELGLKVSKVFPVGTIMITIAANIGDVAILKYPMACPDSLVGIEAKEFVANNIWLMYSLLLKRDELESLATQNAQKNINLQILNSLSIFIPAYQEQKKMAQFLLSVDKKISLQIRKIELLQQYKKGMSQKLFSQKIRFKDNKGNNFPEWIIESISDIADINPKSMELPDNFIYLDLESVENGRITKFNEISKINAPSRAQRLLKFNDVLFQLVRPYQKNNLHFKENKICVASTGYAQLRVQKKYYSSFLFQLIQIDKFTDSVMNLCTGTSYPAINSSALSSIKCSIPCVEEQQKIADFLSSIDDKITIENNKLDKLKQWKQGLLQQMFV